MVRKMDRVSVDRAAALLSYPIAYIYLYWFMTNDYTYRPRLFTQWSGHFLFSVLFVLAVEGYSKACGRDLASAKREQPALFGESCCLAALILLQSLALLLYGPHADDVAVAQVLFWHFTCIYYVCARTGILTARRTGVFFLLDAVNGVFIMPFRHFFLRLICLLRRGKRVVAGAGADFVGAGIGADQADAGTDTGTAMAGAAGPLQAGCGTVHLEAGIGAELQTGGKRSARSLVTPERLKKAAVFCFTLFLAGTVCSVAWHELAGASEAFGRLGQGVAEFLARILSFRGLAEFLEEYLPYVVFSIPIGAYLFGLVGGGLSDRSDATREKKIREGLVQYRILPAYSVYLILGSLLTVYLLFFAVQAAGLAGILFGAGGRSLRELVSVQEACRYAVGGFWQLVRVVLLNFAVLLGLMLLSKIRLFEEKRPMILIDLLFACAAAFAVLAGFKLFVLYFYQYGPTPRRILAGWMVVMQLLWCVLALIRFHRRFPAVKIGVYAGAVSFTILMLLDIDRICGYV